MLKYITLESNGKPFNVVVVMPGDQYPNEPEFVKRHGPRINTNNYPVIAVYDGRYTEGYGFSPVFGQFVCDYCWDTLQEDRDKFRNCALSLMGYEPEWTLSASAMRRLYDWMDTLGFIKTEGEKKYAEIL